MSLTLAEYRMWLDGTQARCWQRPHPLAAWQMQSFVGTPEAALAELLDGARGRVSLRLGGSLAPTVCLPWLDGLHQPGDWQGYARQWLSRHFGGEPEDWLACWQWQPAGRNTLACGVRLAHWQVWRALLQRLSLLSVRPVWPLLAQRHRPPRQVTQTLLLRDGDVLQWLLHEQGQWQQGGILRVEAGLARQAVLDRLAELSIPLVLPRWFSLDDTASQPFVWSES
ncbi:MULTISPECIES: hypothetical protein [unclassified Paludibacterium]|uniref:hypothetical protein n=1 Tax=unclassified Paludibacterium TaxID=2618429 RepID=UPI001C046BBC|nr:hypothetical protein [Paludibacterium sp. B53371]BEV73038.1 hypothetical protein THUN1379_25200 [Paludibacterium sp. THUN1379]